MQGRLSKKQKLIVMSTGRRIQVEKVGIFTPKPQDRDALETGEVGFVVASIKDIDGAPVGDTLTDAAAPIDIALPGFQAIKPRVFAGMFPIDATDYEAFREALAKLRLNDAALHYEPETSQALGFGFRCGFLGMLHKEIVQERLEREYQLNLISTAPTVIYEILSTSGEILMIDNPADLPPINQIAEMREPIVEANILLPQDYLGNIINLCVEKRGIQKKLHYTASQVTLTYELPLNDMVLDFFDRLKSVKMKEVIPRQMYDVAIQAAIGTHIIARQTVKAFRKNVTAKCYGGDVSRKRKLLEKQKEGKKRMKKVGSVVIPQDAFLAVLQVGKK